MGDLPPIVCSFPKVMINRWIVGALLLLKQGLMCDLKLPYFLVNRGQNWRIQKHVVNTRRKNALKV